MLRLRINYHPLGWGVPALLLAACSGGGARVAPGAALVPSASSGVVRTANLNSVGVVSEPGGPRLTLSPSRARRAGWMSPRVTRATTGPLLYVTDVNKNVVDIFPQKDPTAPIGQITNGISEPAGIAVDSTKNIYVANIGADTVTKYRPGGTKPVKTYSAGMTQPTWVAVGADGTLYVSSCAYGTVIEYAPKSSQPTLIITMPSTPSATSCPEGLTLDGSNNLYVAFNDVTHKGQGRIDEFAPGASSGTDLGIGLAAAAGIQLDTAGDIIAVDQVAKTINVYPPGHTSPSKQIFGFGQPFALALNHRENRLFVSDVANNNVLTLGYPGGAKLHKVGGFGYVTGVAASPEAPK